MKPTIYAVTCSLRAMAMKTTSDQDLETLANAIEYLARGIARAAHC